MSVLKLGDFCEFKYGSSLPAAVRIGDAFPVYGSNGIVGTHEAPLTRGKTIVVGRKGSIGEINFSNGPCWPIDTTYFIDETCTRTDLRWLHYALNGLRLGDLNKATGVPGLNRNDAYERELFVPPLDEQKRIAAILDQADELRRKRKQALDRLNQLGQAIFYEMFGDPKTNPKTLPWASLGEVADFYSGNSLPEGTLFSDQYHGYLLLKVSDLNHPLNQHDIICAANWSAYPGSRAGTCPPDALIFPKRGGAIGTNKKRWLRRSAILDPNLMGVHPDRNRLTMPFLCGWFDTFNLSDIASGSSVPQLNKQDLAPLQLALPPLSEQQDFAKRIGEIASMRANIAQAYACDNRLFDVLQHRAFRGEL